MADERISRRMVQRPSLEFSYGLLEENAQPVKIAVDGAWQVESFTGVAAWCVKDASQGP